MGNLISQLRVTPTGSSVRMWEVPDDVELEPGPGWVEQPPDPAVAALIGAGGEGWRPPWAQP